jgi:hypothetical protein
MGLLDELWGGIVKLYEASPRFMVALAIVAALFLFLPASALTWFALDPIIAKYHGWISGIFLFSSVVTITYPITTGWDRSLSFLKGRQRLKRGEKRLHLLDTKEKAILNSYVSQNTRTQYFDYNNGAVAHLQLSGILLCPRKCVRTDKAPFVLADWAWDYLHKHPELLLLDGNPLPDLPPRKRR